MSFGSCPLFSDTSTSRAEITSMGFLSWLRGSATPKNKPGRTIGDLAQRMKMSEAQLCGIHIAYQQFQIPKRRKGMRQILAPVAQLKQIQRQILRRVLGGLKPHPCATGFSRGHSIVSNALPHVGKAALVRMDLKDFFPSTPARRVKEFFEAIGWSTEAANLLTRLCTYQEALPQGAPTSPKLSNLLNQRLDARLSRLAEVLNASYTRYAD
ncbi:MAG TPA: reverse transcriptase family protein, partial [Tepidisphaeraceae bacterium]|nr:reverse transcriptase family protein [Tepidisphaeraceae bacterium]